MSVRDAQRPLNGTPLRFEPVVVMGWDGRQPKVTLKLSYDARATFDDPERINQLIEDLQVAYGHLTGGPSE